MLKESYSHQVLNETLVKRATGKGLNRLSNFYGFERPLYIKDQYWRDALNSVLFNARGTHGVIFAFLENLFKEWSEYSTYTMTGLSTTTLQGSNLNCNYEGRLCKINGKIYYSTVLNGNDLSFASVSTAYWNKADFQVSQSYSVQLLPFIYTEINGEFKLQIDGGVFSIPSTYLNEDGEPQGSNEPPYNFIYDFFSNTQSERIGSYPIYLNTDFFESNFFSAIKNVLASGIKIETNKITWCNTEDSLYASITDLIKYNTVNPNNTNSVQPARS